MEPDVSIIIINYNTFQLTCNCIDSVYRNTHSIPFEIILVDNGSTECDPNQFKEVFPDIILVNSEKNLGFAGGNNLGISKSKGEYILLLNSDTILLNNAVKLTYERMVANDNIAISSCNLLNADRSTQNVCEPFPSIKQELTNLFRLSRFKHFNYSKEGKPDMVWGAFFMIKTQYLKSVFNGRLPSSFFMYVEDMEWCYLMRKAGFQIGYFPEGKVIHLFSGDKIKRHLADNMGFRNEIIFLKKYYPKSIYNTIFCLRLLNDLSRLNFKYLVTKLNFYFKDRL